MSAALTATRAGLVRCGSCEKLLRARPLPPGARARCPRCGAGLSRRKPQSLARSWALLIAAIICYVPANLYPVMEVAGPGGSEADTILSGVQAMFAAGWYPVGLLIFFASIPRDRAVLYRVVEIVGRWSMLDMFVVSVMVALVQLGAVANVEPRIGATFFAAVVVLTIFAAQSFDPRLIWDAMEEEQ